MNAFILGEDKTPILDYVPYENFLLLDDGPLADQIATPVARHLDLDRHTLNPLPGIDYKRARELAAIFYAAKPHGEHTLTVRNGRRALQEILLDPNQPRRLDLLRFDKSDAHQEAKGMVDDLLFSPLLRRFLCTSQPSFPMKGTIIARLNRAELGDEDTFITGNLLMLHYPGQVIVPDFGFYACPFHVSLIRQNRLIVGLHHLHEVTTSIRNSLLLMDTKVAKRCTAEDAAILAKYAGLVPDITREDNPYTRFIKAAVSGEE